MSEGYPKNFIIFRAIFLDQINTLKLILFLKNLENKFSSPPLWLTTWARSPDLLPHASLPSMPAARHARDTRPCARASPRQHIPARPWFRCTAPVSSPSRRLQLSCMRATHPCPVATHQSFPPRRPCELPREHSASSLFKPSNVCLSSPFSFSCHSFFISIPHRASTN